MTSHVVPCSQRHYRWQDPSAHPPNCLIPVQHPDPPVAPHLPCHRRPPPPHPHTPVRLLFAAAAISLTFFRFFLLAVFDPSFGSCATPSLRVLAACLPRGDVRVAALIAPFAMMHINVTSVERKCKKGTQIVGSRYTTPCFLNHRRFFEWKEVCQVCLNIPIHD